MDMVVIPSATTPRVVWTVTRRGTYLSCDCPAFFYRKKCHHVREARLIFDKRDQERLALSKAMGDE